MKTVFDAFKGNVKSCNNPYELAGMIDSLQTAAKLWNIKEVYIENHSANIEKIELSVEDFVRYLEQEEK